MLSQILIIVLTAFAVSDASKEAEYSIDGTNLHSPMAKTDRPEIILDKSSPSNKFSSTSYDGPRVDVLDNKESYKGLNYAGVVFPSVSGTNEFREGSFYTATIDSELPATTILPSEHVEYEALNHGPSFYTAKIDSEPPAAIILPSEYVEYETVIHGPSAPVFKEKSYKSVNYVYPSVSGANELKEGSVYKAKIYSDPPATITLPSEHVEYEAVIHGPSAPIFKEKTVYIDFFENDFECPKIEKVVYVKVYPQCTCQPVQVRANMVSSAELPPTSSAELRVSRVTLQLTEKRQNDFKSFDGGEHALTKRNRNFKVLKLDDDEIFIVKDFKDGDDLSIVTDSDTDFYKWDY